LDLLSQVAFGIWVDRFPQPTSGLGSLDLLSQVAFGIRVDRTAGVWPASSAQG
jgi:hypothetical protein